MERWFPIMVGAFIIILLGGIGCAVRFGKAYWLISGYNTMPEEKKRNVDTAGLGRFLGNSLFAGCGIIAVAMAFFALGLPAGGIITLALLLPGIVWLLIGAQKYDRNALDADGSFKTGTKIVIAVATVLLAASGVAAGVLMSQGSRAVEYSIVGGSLEIKGMFGETIPLQEIAGLELTEAMPEIALRTNGSAMGEALRGSFKLGDGTAARIFIENAEPPFIHFTRNGLAYYLNGIDSEKTKTIYSSLVSAAGK